jgi:lycopene beta-cyclase
MIMTSLSPPDYDIIFVGGGLAATLAAYRLRSLRPECRVLVLERGPHLGGNHTWSFHETDISREARAWVAPFVARSWAQQEVRFPKYTRKLPVGYNSIFSESLHRGAMTLLDGHVRFGVSAETLEPGAVTLDTGERVTAHCVVDARGPARQMPLSLCYQKFLGIEVELEAPHGQSYPIIMDATVRQRDGYRFIYTLPLSANRVLIEDTYYSDTPDVDAEDLRQECMAYAAARGWRVARELREERGVLPLVLGGDIEAVLAAEPAGVPKLGLRAALFHYTTSYSFPVAIRCAELIASVSPLDSATLNAALTAWAREHWKAQGMFRLLNRMLFLAAKPEERYRVLQRFYSLPQPLIERFYSGSLSLTDQARILVGKPPVPISKALQFLHEAAAVRAIAAAQPTRVT